MKFIIMKRYYHDMIRSVVQALEIQSDAGFSWFGKKEKLLPSRLLQILPAVSVRAHMVNTIQSKLYNNFYCKGYPAPLRVNESTIPLISSKVGFANKLADSNRGSGYKDDGWKVLSMDDGIAVLQKNGIRFSVDRKDCSLQSDAILQQENRITFLMPKELRSFSPGFYMALSDENFLWDDTDTIVRIYWNLLPDGAYTLMQEITTSFNEAQIPYRFKTIDHPARFTRCDAAVIYLHRKNYHLAKAILERVYLKVEPCLKNEIPAFTKGLANGLGLAEDPALGSSFGMHRCQIIAEGLVHAYELGVTALDKRIEIVENWFADKGISLEKPYLNPGSSDIFGFAPAIPSSLNFPGNGNVHNGDSSTNAYLKTAMEIGQILIDKAVWHRDRCNWMGIDFYRNALITGEPSRLVFKALGPEVYSGTAGIALFLAELYKTTGNAAARAASLAAIRQSLSTAHLFSSSASLGLHDGLVGISFLSAYIGRLLNEEQILNSSKRLLHQALLQQREVHYLDQVSGNAGAIVALLILKEILCDESLLAYAKGLGEELVQKAETKNGCCSWRSAGFPTQQNLLGYSHGTSGIARALLELYRATGDAVYSKLAVSAFNYEAFWFNKEMNNWPDFRGINASAKKKNRLMDFPVFWCHGAAGIALSRLCAYKILQQTQYRSEALLATAITSEWTNKMLDMKQVNFSLCHGLSGNAEILLEAFSILGKECAPDTGLAMKVAGSGIRMYASQDHCWPLDTPARHAPGLMTGLSGIGLFYLRLYNKDIPSFLVMDPEPILKRLL